MENPIPDPFADGFAKRVIRRKARQLTSYRGFTASDQEDLEQELALALIRSWPRYDSQRGNTQQFIKQIVCRKAKQILRRRYQDARHPDREEHSLNEELQIDDNNSASRHETHDAEKCMARRGRCDPYSARLVSLRLDLEMLLDRLPPEACALVREIQSKSPVEIAREMGVSHMTIQRRLAKCRAMLEILATEKSFKKERSFRRGKGNN